MEELINSEITGDFIRKAFTDCNKMVFFEHGDELRRGKDALIGINPP